MKRKKFSVKEKLKEYYFSSPTSKLRVREIEKKLKLPLPSVIRYTKELKEEGILEKLEIGNTVFYTSDRTNSSFLIEKRLYNIRCVYSSGLIDFLKSELHNPAIILFGSYSKGEDIEDSDIDIFIQTSSKKPLDLQRFEKILGRKIEIFRNSSLKDIKNINLANNIVNGTSINGHVEVFI